MIKVPLQTCIFCELFEESMKIEKRSEFETRFGAAIVRTTLVNGAARGRITNYIKDGKGAPLTFCPTCGKKLEYGQ